MLATISSRIVCNYLQLEMEIVPMPINKIGAFIHLFDVFRIQCSLLTAEQTASLVLLSISIRLPI